MEARYRLLHVQGQGSFGVVYRAFDQQCGRYVALKLSEEPSAMSRALFSREAAFLSRIQHRSVIALLDHDTNAKEPYLALELCDRGSLRGMVGKLHWRRSVCVLLEIALGLREIHQAGIVHCDLKPENLLIGSQSQGPDIAKIADLGCAQACDNRGNRYIGVRGSRGYLAPEVLQGMPFDTAADIYSLGIVATELLTGVRDESSLDATPIPSSLIRLVRAMRSKKPAFRVTLHLVVEALFREVELFGERIEHCSA